MELLVDATEHVPHAVLPNTAANFPTLQAEHTVLPDPENRPCWHTAQVELPLRGWNKPERHGLQTVALVTLE